MISTLILVKYSQIPGGQMPPLAPLRTEALVVLLG